MLCHLASMCMIQKQAGVEVRLTQAEILQRGLTLGYWPFPTAEQVRILPRYLAMLHATPYVDQSDYLPDSSVGLEGGLGFKHSVNIGYWPFRATFAK